MKSTGIVRKVDDLGRVVIPKEIRRVLEIDDRAALEIYVDGDKVILKKYTDSESRKQKEQDAKDLDRFKMKASASDKQVLERIQNHLLQ